MSLGSLNSKLVLPLLLVFFDQCAYGRPSQPFFHKMHTCLHNDQGANFLLHCFDGRDEVRMDEQEEMNEFRMAEDSSDLTRLSG